MFDYIAGIWLVGVVITSLFVIHRLNDGDFRTASERIGAVICTVLVSLFWFVTMPYLWWCVRKIKCGNR